MWWGDQIGSPWAPDTLIWAPQTACLGTLLWKTKTHLISTLFKLLYWGEQYPPIYVPPEPQNVTLFGNRLFADAISQDESKPDLSDPKSKMTGVLVRKEIPRQSTAGWRSGNCMIGHSCQKGEAIRESSALLTPWFKTCSFQNCGRKKCLLFSAPQFVILCYGSPRKPV